MADITGRIVLRLERIKYQLLQGYGGSFTNEQIVSMVYSIYDAAIEAGMDADLLASGNFPAASIGNVALSWFNNNTTLQVNSLDAGILEDLTAVGNELHDAATHTAEVTTNFLAVGADLLVLSSNVNLNLILAI